MAPFPEELSEDQLRIIKTQLYPDEVAHLLQQV